MEPITEWTGIIKGHTSVKGKVALSINNKFINFEESGKSKKTLTEEEGDRRLKVSGSTLMIKDILILISKRKDLII